MISFFSAKELAGRISERAKLRRVQMNITQSMLADRAGVSYGSVKRFEQSGEISLKHLLQIAIVLDAVDEFEALFRTTAYRSVREMVDQKKKKQKKRARRNDS